MFCQILPELRPIKKTNVFEASPSLFSIHFPQFQKSKLINSKRAWQTKIKNLL